MKNLFQTIIIIVSLTNLIIAQINSMNSEVNSIFLPQGYVLESISGYGYSNATKTSISNISSSNPASLSEFQRLSFGVSLQSDSDIEEAWVAKARHKRINNNLPQSYGFVVPIKNFRIGYGFYQRYNTKLEFDKLEISTIAYPEGSGEYFIPILKTYVTTNSVSASFSIYRSNIVFSLGVQYSWSKLFHYEEMYNTNISNNDSKDNWSVGVRFDKQNKLKLGLFYENGLKFKSTTINYAVVPDTFETVGYISNSFFVVGNIPKKIHFGFSYQMFSKTQFIGNSSYVFWNNISKYFKDQVELSGSVVHRLNGIISFSAGFYKTNREYSQGHALIGDNKRLSAVYMIGGLILRFDIMEIELTVADSHLFSGNWRKQTIGKVGFGIYL